MKRPVARPTPRPTPLTIEQRLDMHAAAMDSHAKRCRECCMPIIDDEGNPGYLSEACRAGVRLLEEYAELEVAYFKERR